MGCAWCKKNNKVHSIKIGKENWHVTGYCSEICSIASMLDIARGHLPHNVELRNRLGETNFRELRRKETMDWMKSDGYKAWKGKMDKWFT